MQDKQNKLRDRQTACVLFEKLYEAMEAVYNAANKGDPNINWVVQRKMFEAAAYVNSLEKMYREKRETKNIPRKGETVKHAFIHVWNVIPTFLLFAIFVSTVLCSCGGGEPRDDDADGFYDIPTRYDTPTCSDGVCYYDIYDCNDADPNVFPGQTDFFSLPAVEYPGHLRFDFDCDGTETMMHDVLWDEDAGIYGWETKVPACGQLGRWIGKDGVSATGVQICR